MECGPKEPRLPQIEKLFELVKKSVDDIADDNANNPMGVLGNRFSTRYRIVQLLENFYKQQTNLFYDEDYKQQVKLATDDIYNYQFIETTRKECFVENKIIALKINHLRSCVQWDFQENNQIWHFLKISLFNT